MYTLIIVLIISFSIAYLVILLINYFINLCYKKELKKIITSDQYKKSIYKIQIFNGYYVLNFNEEWYVDLKDTSFDWKRNDKCFRHCKGSLPEVIKAYNEREPRIEEIKSLITL